MDSVYSFGSESGMEDYADGPARCVLHRPRQQPVAQPRFGPKYAGQYGIDLFIGSTLQMDADANSSTVTRGRLPGFGGAANLGHNPGGRRRCTDPAWLSLITGGGEIVRGRKLVVQMVETVSKSGIPAFVETLDAVQVGKEAGMPIAPIMIYGDDVSHVVTEKRWLICTRPRAWRNGGPQLA